MVMTMRYGRPSMDFVDELDLAVEIIEGVPRLTWTGTPLRDDDMRQEIAAMGDGKQVLALCRFTNAEVAVVRLVPPGTPHQLTPRREIRGYLERSYRGQALEELAALGAERVERDKELLGMRLRASHADLALADFVKLLALPETSPIDLQSAFEHIRGPARRKAAPLFSRWVASHLERVARWGVPWILEEVGVASWPLEVLLAACEHSFDRHYPTNDYVSWLARAVKLAPSDPRVVAIQRRAEIRAREVETYDQAARGDRLTSRPDFDGVERRLGAKLPAHLRAAWEAWYEGAHPELRFIHVRRDRLDDLADTVDFIRNEHDDLGPIFPFAEGAQAADYFVLDLSRRTEDGDAPVLHVIHDLVDGVDEVAETSAQWLARGGRNWTEA